MKKSKDLLKLFGIAFLVFAFKLFLDKSAFFQYSDIVLDDSGLKSLDAEFWLKKINDSVQNNGTDDLITLIDLKSKLSPKSLYRPIKCRKSLMFTVRTTLCVHSIENDIHVSGSIWRDGIWEEHVISNKRILFILSSKTYILNNF